MAFPEGWKPFTFPTKQGGKSKKQLWDSVPSWGSTDSNFFSIRKSWLKLWALQYITIEINPSYTAFLTPVSLQVYALACPSKRQEINSQSDPKIFQYIQLLRRVRYGATHLPNTAVHIWASYLDSYFNLVENNKLWGANTELGIGQMTPPRNHLVLLH